MTSQTPGEHPIYLSDSEANYIVMKNNSIGMKFKKGVGADHLFHCLSLH